VFLQIWDARQRYTQLIFMSTVLVVEDSRTQREMISELLRRSGLNVTAVSDGIEALQEVQGHCPDIVVLDIILPRMNGYEVCRRLKSDKKIQKPPIIMCSRKSERFDLYWALKQGADAYLDKPFRPEELVETVKYLLRESSHS
jgi:twitching motility two-component system response regulator PilH